MIKYLFALVAPSLPLLVAAQPGDIRGFLPCPPVTRMLFPMDSARADLRVQVRAEGTEDVPSNSGHCMLVVSTEDHTRLLYMYDQHGALDLWRPASGDRLTPDDLRIGLERGRFRWEHGQVEVAWRGYGHQYAGERWVPVDPEGRTNACMRVTTGDDSWLAVVQVRADAENGLDSVRVIARAREGDELTVP